MAGSMLPDGKNGAFDVGTIPRLHAESVQANMALKFVLAIALGHNANQLICKVMQPAMASADNNIYNIIYIYNEAILFVLDGTTPRSWPTSWPTLEYLTCTWTSKSGHGPAK